MKKNNSTGKMLNDSIYKKEIIEYIEKGVSDAQITKTLRNKYNKEFDVRTIKAFRKNFIISNKDIQERIKEEKKKQDEKIKAIKEKIPLQLFEMIEARKNDIGLLNEEIARIKQIQCDVHEHRNTQLEDILQIYTTLKNRLLNFKPMNEKEGKVLRQLEFHLDSFEKFMKNKVVGLYYAKNDLTIAKCLDSIRVLRVEIEQYTQMYDLHGLIDEVSKKIILEVSKTLIPEIPNAKLKHVAGKFRINIENIVEEIKNKIALNTNEK